VDQRSIAAFSERSVCVSARASGGAVPGIAAFGVGRASASPSPSSKCARPAITNPVSGRTCPAAR